jgi:uncharacterized 2Fe-2S/4Fe-4S cluster protein (DUF4445 family)
VGLTILPEGLTVDVAPGVSVLEACREHDIDLPGICGGRGRCRECRVTVIDRVVAPSALDQSLLEPDDIARGWRLSCQLKVDGNLTVELPPVSLKLLDPSVVLPQLASVEPVIQEVSVNLPDASDESDRPAIALLEDALLEKGVRLRRSSIAALRELGLALSRREPSVRCLVHEGVLLDVRSRSASTVYGLAIDIGTSTVSMALLDLTTLAMLSVETERNPQGAYGGDFMSRIAFAMEKEENLLELHGKIIQRINRMIDRLVVSYGLARKDIVLATVAGNAVMHHLFFGLDVKALGGFPFRPVLNDLLTVPAAELALRLEPATPVVGLPLISGYIGADTVAVMIALDLLGRADTVIAVDVGTNAEVALVHRGRLYVCSAPAGPAFEGAQMACGTQARPGAITKIAIDDVRQQLRIDTVEEKPAFGIAGTGIVDLVAELVRVGVLDTSGRMLDTEEWPAWLRERAHLAGEMRAFIVARDPENRPLYLHQGDVRELQLAKAATATAIHYVMDAAKVTAAELDRVYVAGAFGSYLDPVSILRIALLPEVPLERVEFIGNAALAGAVLATLSRKHLDNAVRVARDAVRVDMATDESFQDVFVDKLRLAH